MMINTMLIEKNINYGKKLISSLAVKNDNFRLCGIVNNKKEMLFLMENIEVDIKIFDMPIDEGSLIMHFLEEKKKQSSVILMLDKNVEISNSYIDFFMNNKKLDYNIKTEDVYNDADKINSIISNKLNIYNETINKRKNENDVRDKINNELSYLGYNLKHYGSKYIAETIFILYTARDYCDENLEGKIYPVVAKKFEKTINNIKTNIKNATDIMYYECEEEVLRKYLGHCYFSKPKPKEVMLNVLKRIS